MVWCYKASRVVCYKGFQESTVLGPCKSIQNQYWKLFLLQQYFHWLQCDNFLRDSLLPESGGCCWMRQSSSRLAEKLFLLENYCCLGSSQPLIPTSSLFRSFPNVTFFIKYLTCTLWTTASGFWELLVLLGEWKQEMETRRHSLFLKEKVNSCAAVKIVSLLAKFPRNSLFWRWLKGESPHSLPSLCFRLCFCSGTLRKEPGKSWHVSLWRPCVIIMRAVKVCCFKDFFFFSWCV